MEGQGEIPKKKWVEYPEGSLVKMNNANCLGLYKEDELICVVSHYITKLESDLTEAFVVNPTVFVGEATYLVLYAYNQETFERMREQHSPKKQGMIAVNMNNQPMRYFSPYLYQFNDQLKKTSTGEIYAIIKADFITDRGGIGTQARIGTTKRPNQKGMFFYLKSGGTHEIAVRPEELLKDYEII